MLLKNALDLKRSIDENRRNMYELASNNGISDPEVVKVSQELDGKIIILQNLLSQIVPHKKKA